MTAKAPRSPGRSPGWWREAWHRWTHFEHWPWQVFYAPAILWWVWKSLWARAAFWPSAVNPGQPNSGFVEESKWDTLQHLQPPVVPHSLLWLPQTPLHELPRRMAQNGVALPVVVKPDVGERGKGVHLVGSMPQLESLLAGLNTPQLVQNCVELPCEAGLMYVRHPEQPKGSVTSIVLKGFLTVTGDGRQSLQQLACASYRGRRQWARVQQLYNLPADRVLTENESLLLEPIGNHSRGTTFLNGQHLRSAALDDAVQKICDRIPGFYYGRLDVRCPSPEALQRGEGLVVLEVNGASSEPGHIYQPGTSVWAAWRSVLWHWRQMYAIARENHRRGTPYMSSREGFALLRRHFL